MYKSKAAVKSLGVMGPLFAILVIGAGMFGVDLSDLVSGLPELIAKGIDDALIISGIVAGIIGRLKAAAKITGVFNASPTFKPR